MKQYKARTILALSLLWLGMSYGPGPAIAQCYPGLSCPDSSSHTIPDPASTRPASPIEDCTLDGSIRYCASSILPPQGKNSYQAANLIDGKPATAWVEGQSDHGVGEWIIADFTRPRIVRNFRIRNGYAKNKRIFSRNSRIKDLEIHFSNGKTQRVTLADTPELQIIQASSNGLVNWVQLKIRSVYRGSKYNDTAISELRIGSE